MMYLSGRVVTILVVCQYIYSINSYLVSFSPSVAVVDDKCSSKLSTQLRDHQHHHHWQKQPTVDVVFVR